MDVKRIKNVYRLSPLQEGILFHNLESKDSSAYFEQLTFTIHGPLSLETLQTAWQKTLSIRSASPSTSESSAEVASSSTRIGASFRKTRAMAIR